MLSYKDNTWKSASGRGDVTALLTAPCPRTSGCLVEGKAATLPVGTRPQGGCHGSSPGGSRRGGG